MANLNLRGIASFGPQPQGTDTRMIIELADGTTYTINQNSLNKFKTAEELKTALESFLGYSVDNVWFHLNRNGNWAIATGLLPPDRWPEDEVT